MTEPLNVEQAAAMLRNADNILILCHKNPDGDTIGCGSALYYALASLGKTAAVLCSDPIPRRLSYTRPRLFRGEFEPGLVVAVDVAGTQLFGDSGLMPSYSRRVDLCIDHHAGNNGYAQYTLLNPEAAAAAELLWEVIEAMGVQLDSQMADCLYTGLATDTGCFRFTSTTARTHRMAARLIEAGADIGRLNELLFECRSRSRIEAEREALESLEYYCGGRCAMICLTRDQILQTGVANAELEDLTSLPRSIEGVEVGLTLRQQKDGSYKISIRTAGTVDACAVARHLGGGGHSRAAGCEISGNLDNAKRAILQEVEKELARQDAEAEPRH